MLKGFAEGGEIQMECPETGEWVDVPSPTFAPEFRWRIRPEHQDFHDWWAGSFAGWPSTEKDIALKAWTEAKKRTLNGN